MYWLKFGDEYMKLQHYPEAIKAYVISMRNKELQDVKDAVSLGRLSVVNEDKRKLYVTSLKNLQLCHFKLVSKVSLFFNVFFLMNIKGAYFKNLTEMDFYQTGALGN